LNKTISINTGVLQSFTQDINIGSDLDLFSLFDSVHLQSTQILDYLAFLYKREGNRYSAVKTARKGVFSAMPMFS